jgi:hypothetical protein
LTIQSRTDPHLRAVLTEGPDGVEVMFLRRLRGPMEKVVDRAVISAPFDQVFAAVAQQLS